MCCKAEQFIHPKEVKKIIEELNGEADDCVSSKVEQKQIIFPNYEILIVRLLKGKYIIETMKWGLIIPAVPRPLINKRVEDIHIKNYWKNLFANSRLLIPLTAFYEWRKADRQQIRITLKDETVFFAAGFWIEAKDNKCENRCTMLTCSPNAFMEDIHNRMPVIFNKENCTEFLNSETNHALSICKPFSESKLMKSEEINTKR